MTDPGLPRFLMLQSVRLTCALAALLGAVILGGAQPAFAQVPVLLGEALFVGGALGFFGIPLLLSRRWKAAGKPPGDAP